LNEETNAHRKTKADLVEVKEKLEKETNKKPIWCSR
jgi:hypothetical protein